MGYKFQQEDMKQMNNMKKIPLHVLHPLHVFLLEFV
jgi:hypothetical protein